MKFPISLAKIFGQNKKPKNLEGLLKSGLLSKEEFLRFKITRQQMILDKAKKELLNYLKKQAKK